MRKLALLLIGIIISFTVFAAQVNQNSGIEALASSLIENVFGELNGNYVVGDPIKAGNMTLIPLCSIEISFGGGLGGSPAVGGGGMGKVNVTPMGFLAIKDGKAWFIPLEREPQPQKDTFEKAMEIFDRVYPILMQLIKNWQPLGPKPEIKPEVKPEVKLEDKPQVSESLEKVKELYKSGDLKGAYDKLEKYLKKVPNSITAHLMLAKISGELAQKSKGVDQMKYGIKTIKEYEKVITLDPENLEGLIGYGYSKLYAPAPLGSLKQAQESFEKALKLDPQNVAALLGMAETLKKMGFEHKAEEYYKKVLEIDPNNKTAKEALEDK